MDRTSMTTTLGAMAACLLIAPPAVLAESGFYIGGSAGGANIEADLDGVTIPGLPSSIDEDDTAIKLFAGYNFDLPTIDLAVEAGYVDFGEPDIDISGDTLLVDTKGINVWGIAALDVGPVAVFGKVGMISWDVEASFQDSGADDDGTDLGYGLGLRFGLGPVDIRGEYELYDLDDTDLTMLSLGVSYMFD